MRLQGLLCLEAVPSPGIWGLLVVLMVLFRYSCIWYTRTYPVFYCWLSTLILWWPLNWVPSIAFIEFSCRGVTLELSNLASASKGSRLGDSGIWVAYPLLYGHPCREYRDSISSGCRCRFRDWISFVSIERFLSVGSRRGDYSRGDYRTSNWEIELPCSLYWPLIGDSCYFSFE